MELQCTRRNSRQSHPAAPNGPSGLLGAMDWGTIGVGATKGGHWARVRSSIVPGMVGRDGCEPRDTWLWKVVL
jgi:hypothetical protein